MLQGMTTTKEAWNDGSLNHVNLTAPVDAWFYSALAGIRIDDRKPGYEQVIIKPYIPSDLDSVNSWVETSRGRIVSSWRKEKDVLYLELTIPANMTAVVYMPASAMDTVREGDVPAANAKSVHAIGFQDNAAVFHIGSGRYCFSANSSQLKDVRARP